MHTVRFPYPLNRKEKNMSAERIPEVARICLQPPDRGLGDEREVNRWWRHRDPDSDASVTDYIMFEMKDSDPYTGEAKPTYRALKLIRDEREEAGNFDFTEMWENGFPDSITDIETGDSGSEKENCTFISVLGHMASLPPTGFMSLIGVYANGDSPEEAIGKMRAGFDRLTGIVTGTCQVSKYRGLNQDETDWIINYLFRPEKCLFVFAGPDKCRTTAEELDHIAGVVKARGGYGSGNVLIRIPGRIVRI